MKSFINNKGFTLIELLVVIVLLGIITSFAVLSMGSGSAERKMEEEAKRLHALIKLVREESIIQAKEIAIEIKKQDYMFVEYENKEWVPLTSKIFHARSIAEELDFRVDTDSQSKIFKSDKKDKELIRLYFLSSGEQTPFEINIKVKELSYPYYRLVGKFNGKLKLERIGEYGK